MEVVRARDTIRTRTIGARLLAGLLLVAAVGCVMGQAPTRVAWDLRHGHTKQAVQWSGPTSAREVANADATILLPGDRTFEGQGVTIRMFSSGDQLQVLAIQYPKTTLDDGYRQARQLSQRWRLQTGDLDRWYQDVQAGRKQGVKDSKVRFDASMSGQPLGPDGPTPVANVLDSFDDAKPFLLDLEFQWNL